MAQEADPFLQVLPSVLVVIGWLIVNQQNNKREERKETRAAIEAIKKYINEIEELAIEHHTNATFDEALVDQIIRFERKISNETRYLQLIELRRDRLVKQLRQAITLRNFDSSTFKAQNLQSDIVEKIRTAKDQLIDEFESAFSCKYRSPWWRICMYG